MKNAILILAFASANLIGQFSRIAPPTSLQRHPVPVLIGTSSIEGTVLNSVTREPIRKATVTLFGATGMSAITDSTGRFAFRKLPEGAFSLQVQNDDYPVPAQPIQVSLKGGEQKKDVELALAPGASIQGRVVDEDGNPMSRCTASHLAYRETEMGRSLQVMSSAQTGDKGEFKIPNLAPGKYFVMAQCRQTIILPHALVRRDAAIDLPSLTYPPVLYPGVPSVAGATRIELTAGAKITGVDFRMAPATGVTVRGSAGHLPNVNITLRPASTAESFHQISPTRFNRDTGEFRFLNVLPGSYELIATDHQTHYVKIPLVVGSTAPVPVEMQASEAPSLSGTVAFEGDIARHGGPLQIFANSIDGGGPARQAEVDADGTFTLSSVFPGHWRIWVSNAPGFIKSATMAGQDVSVDHLDISTAAAGPLKILYSDKYAQVDVGIDSAPAAATQEFGVIWKVGESGRFQQNFGLQPRGRTTLSIPPGKYLGCGFDSSQMNAMQNAALRKALESRCEKIETSESGPVKVQLPYIATEEIKRLLDKLEE